MKEEPVYDAEGVVGVTATEEELTTVFRSVSCMRIRIDPHSICLLDPDSDPAS
jgi:hypothetical protein